MNMDIITFRSITPAQRGQRVLRQGGIAVTLQRTPRSMEMRGCGYCLRIATRDRDRAVTMLQQAGVPFQSAFTGENREKVWP